MFTLDRQTWNDGPEFLNFMGADAAPPVATRHLCYGGGGSSVSTNVPQSPDYSGYIKAMTDIGNRLSGYGDNLYSWAKDQGVNLANIAKAVGDRAGQTADWATGQAKDMLANWQQTYGPIYQAQAKNTTDFINNFPKTAEQWAGKWGADAASAIDQGKQALMRKLQGEGLTRPGVAQGAIDLTQSNQRALGVTAAAEQGRMAALQYRDTLTGQTEQAGSIFPNVSAGLQSTGLAAGNQQVGAPESAVSTTAGAYNPGIAMSNSAFPYMQQWGNSMTQQYQNQLGSFQALTQAQQAANQASSASSPLNFIAPIAGMALSAASPALSAGIGSFMGPVTQGIMSSANKRYAATGGAIRFQEAGAVPPVASAPAAPAPGPVPMAGNVVPAALSPTGGQKTDDVHAVVDGNPRNTAAINVGEFIFPKDVVDWRGEQWMQKEIMKARKERQQQTVAAPTMGPPAGAAGAINMRPPMAAGVPA